MVQSLQLLENTIYGILKLAHDYTIVFITRTLSEPIIEKSTAAAIDASKSWCK